MGKKKDNTSINRHSLISSSPKTSNNSYDMGTHDGFFYSEDESKYLFCGILCTKTFLIIFNFLFLVIYIFNLSCTSYLIALIYFKISGVGFVLFGLWTMYYKQDYVGLFNSFLYQSSTYVLMAAGAMIVITSILGIASAWIESKRLVIMVS
jgi:hypothetical protein